MRVRLLGPVTVGTAEATIDIPVQKQRALLAALALRSPHVVTTSELIDAVWGDEPPTTAGKTLQTYVSALRKQFGGDVIATVPGGYSLGPVVDEIDATELDAAVAGGRALLEQGNAAAARRSFTAGLALWRGRPLEDLAPGPVRDGELARLRELRMLGVEGLMEAELEVGHHREIVPDLERLVAEHPYREVLWRLSMVALYRSGRQADALGAYRRLRTMLVDELGIEPSEETQALELRILDRDQDLDPPATTPPTNIAAPLDSFVDRNTERQAIIDVLAEHRLATVLGIGGVGKSRLANEVGRMIVNDTPGGVWWVDLATVSASRSVLVDVAAAMELPAAAGALDRVLLARLRKAPTILVLDNCEHMHEAVASFAEWITGHDALVKVLATSRVPLGVAGEIHIHVEPLAIDPADGQDVSDASRLFLDRAGPHADMGTTDLDDVEELTDMVGGLPLGIELAAAQTTLRSPDELARMLHNRSAVLELADDRHTPARHASLGHVLDTTFEALGRDLAAVAPRLAVFPGDFDLAAATTVLGGPRADAERDIARLVESSLLVRAASDAPQRRFRVLWPVREYLSHRLDDAGRCDAEARHARHFQAFARRFLDDVNTPGEVAWLDQSRFDDHNLRIALGWYERHDPEGALVFGPGLGWAWEEHGGDQVEGRDTLRRLLGAAPDAPSELVAWTEESLCWLEFLSGDVESAFAHSVDAIERFEELGNPRALSRSVGGQAHALYLGGFDISATAPLYERSIAVARDAGLEFATARAEAAYAQALTAAEEHERVDVEAMLSHAEAVLRRHGDHARLAQAATGRAFIAFGRADLIAGVAAGREIVRRSRLAGNSIWEQIGHVALGLNARAEGDDDESRRRFHDAVRIAHETANRFQLGIALHALAASMAHLEPATAARLWGAAGTMTPLWPLHSRRYGEWLDAARTELGDRFEQLVAEGAELSVDDAVALADTVL